MTTPTRMTQGPSESILGLQDAATFPLLQAIAGRRSRRFGLGMTILDGPLAYTSAHEPIALTELERSLLLLAGTGVTGWHFGMEHTTSGDLDTACNYPLRFTGRAQPSAAGVETAEVIFTDETGTFITQFRDVQPTRLRELQQDDDLDTLLEWVRERTVQLSEQRLDLPQVPPHISPHNVWNANQPGTTLFIPVVDLTQHMLDFLAVYLGIGFTPYDPLHESVFGDLQRFFDGGMLDPAKRFSILDFEQYVLATGAVEIGIICHNMVLMMQAMGLGGWMFTGINPPSALGAYVGQGIAGLGFRFVEPGEGQPPNPVGLDGYLEGWCPPYFSDMRAAVEHFNQKKFGLEGTYAPAAPGPYRDNARVKAQAERYSPEFIEMLGDVAGYIHEAFGKFPASIPSIYARAYAQAQHIDLNYYDQTHGPDSYLETHRQHMQRWHGSPQNSAP